MDSEIESLCNNCRQYTFDVYVDAYRCMECYHKKDDIETGFRDPKPEDINKYLGTSVCKILD